MSANLGILKCSDNMEKLSESNSKAPKVAIVTGAAVSSLIFNFYLRCMIIICVLVWHRKGACGSPDKGGLAGGVL